MTSDASQATAQSGLISPTAGAVLLPAQPTVDSLAKTLLALGVLPSDVSGVPQELATKALGDLSLEITKKTKALITWGSAGGGGAGIVGTIVAGAQGANDSVLVALAFSTAIVLAAGVYGLARVLDGDVRGRSSTSTAAVEARGLITKSLIEAYVAGGPAKLEAAKTTKGSDAEEGHRPSEAMLLSTLAAFDSHVTVTTLDDRSVVHGVRWGDTKRLEVLLANDKWVDADKIVALSAKRP
jgi:hypothetical protein